MAGVPPTTDDDPRSMRERMLAGDPYIAHDPELAAASIRARELMTAYNATSVREESRRDALLGELLGAVGEGTHIRPPLYVDYGSHISIGRHCFANYGLVALDVAPITVGDDVQIGPNVQLLTPTHPIEPGPTSRQMGSRATDHDRRQRLAGRRRHRVPRGAHRRLRVREVRNGGYPAGLTTSSDLSWAGQPPYGTVRISSRCPFGSSQ